MNTDDIAKLKQTLGELRAELDRLDPADSEVRTLLTSALDEIQTALRRQQAGAADSTEDAGLLNRLTTATRDFEESHPQVAGLLGSVIDALSRMGI
jgi:chromosome segregation ATPase